MFSFFNEWCSSEKGNPVKRHISVINIDYYSEMLYFFIVNKAKIFNSSSLACQKNIMLQQDISCAQLTSDALRTPSATLTNTLKNDPILCAERRAANIEYKPAQSSEKMG
jgi:hypothetical protein